jgi:hypothetical protein
MPEKYPVKPEAQPGDAVQPAADDQAAAAEPTTTPLLDPAAQQALVRKLQRKYGL